MLTRREQGEKSERKAKEKRRKSVPKEQEPYIAIVKIG